MCGIGERCCEYFGCGFQWRIEEDAAVCRGWPGFEERAFELNGLNVESWQFPSVREFAADADLADSGEVIHVVFFDFGCGEVADSGVEDVLLNLVAAYFDGESYGSECAAAVPAQSEVDSQPWSAGFKFQEGGGCGVFRWQWCYEQFAVVLWLRECGEDGCLSGGQSDTEDWADVQIAGDIQFRQWSAAFDFCGEVACTELELQRCS